MRYAKQLRFWNGLEVSSNHFSNHAMAKKGRLLAALDALKGRDYRIQKQKTLQKRAAKKKRTRPQIGTGKEKENVEGQPSAMASMPEAESEGWESDESQAAEEATAVCRVSATPNIHIRLSRP